MLLHEAGDAVFAYGAASGQTHVLNDSGAALLRLLAERGPLTGPQAAAALARAARSAARGAPGPHGRPPVHEVHQALAAQWPLFVDAGLVQACAGGAGDAA